MSAPASSSGSAAATAATGATAAAEPWTEPAPWILFLRKYIWLIGIFFFLTMITVMRPLLVHRPPPPEAVGAVPAFAVLNQDGDAFTREQLLAEDKTWVVGFVFTRCPTTCPAVSRAMLHFQEQIADSKLEGHVELITITVDPEYDSPEVLAAYAEKIGADLSNWRFLTADKSMIESLVVGGFKLAVGEREEVEPGVFDIAHSTKLALVDRFGDVRGYYSIDPDGLNELYHRTLRVMRIEEGE